MSFKNLNLGTEILEALESMGIETPTPVQEETIPIILEGKDMIACAQTGTGKTAAYILPILQHIIDKPSKHIDTLIIAPTRELVVQIDQQIEGFSYFLSVNSIPVYGGGDGKTWDTQNNAMKNGCSIVVATPGRLIAHMKFRQKEFKNVRHLILDEADRMLDMGFFDDIVNIIKHLPENRQSLLFSATMPDKIRQLAHKILNQPQEINLAVSKPAEGVLQAAYFIYDNQKNGLINDLIKEDFKDSTIIFASTKKKVDSIVNELSKKKLSVKGIHSGYEQSEREEILRSFQNRKTQILVATDIMSRGIDVEDIGLVINYDIPAEAEDYIHRVGRTARAEATGVALSFINSDDKFKFKRIEEKIGNEIKKLPIPKHLGEAPSSDMSKEKNKRNYKYKKKTFKSKKKNPSSNKNNTDKN